MKSAAAINFFFEQRGFTLAERTALKQFIRQLFRKEMQPLESLNYIFVSDERLLEINRHFLQHDFYTDIITFDLSEGQATIAEIYISVDRVRDNAQLLGVSFKKELHRVIFHGALHLCGYGDKRKSEQKIMRSKEDYFLNQYFK